MEETEPFDDSRGRRSARLANDPDKYIRKVKGRYHARPYDCVDGSRRNLGLFLTPGDARKAILAYWWGKINAKPKYIRKLGDRQFAVVVMLAGHHVRVGSIQTSEDAAIKLARDFLTAYYGRAEAESRISGRMDGATGYKAGRLREAVKR